MNISVQRKLSSTNIVCYKELELKNWKEFIDFIYKNKKIIANCIYRGQSNSSWSLISSFDRENLNVGSNIGEQWREHLREFKRYSQGHSEISYEEFSDREDEWEMLGQHYGLKTRLLDWVRSPFTAAFFSFNGFSKDSNIHPEKRAIFVFDIDRAKELDNVEYEDANLNEDVMPGNRISSHVEMPELFTHSNRRLIAQQGLFTRTSWGCLTIEEHLNELSEKRSVQLGNEVLLLKIILPETERKEILENLNLMNINSFTLFPDLIGAAEHCNYLLKRKT